MMTAVLWNVVAFAAGLLCGMWVQKHPDETRAYGEGLWTRIGKVARWIGRGFKKAPAEPPAGDS